LVREQDQHCQQCFEFVLVIALRRFYRSPKMWEQPAHGRGMLSVGIAPYLGAGLDMITPIIATVLLIFLRVGMNAYCAGRR